MARKRRSLPTMVKLIQEIKEDCMSYRFELPSDGTLKFSLKQAEILCDQLYSILNFAAIDEKMDPDQKRKKNG